MYDTYHAETVAALKIIRFVTKLLSLEMYVHTLHCCCMTNKNTVTLVKIESRGVYCNALMQKLVKHSGN